MSKILFIDGQNFINKLEEALKENKIKTIDWRKFNFKGLFEDVLRNIKIERRIFYFSKLSEHKDTKSKSKKLIETWRSLKAYLENKNQNFEIIIAGRVRGHYEGTIKKVLVFREKGVDVRIAVDMVSLACDKKLKIAILASSDSDLQPAVKELRNRKKEVIYLGFEKSPNKGLTYTTSRTILIRNSEIIKNYTE